MGIAIPQVVTEDRASGALVIDGSLKFVKENFNYLSRTPGSAGNRRTWTWSGWVKRARTAVFDGLFGAENGIGVTQIRINNGNSLMIAFFENGSYYAYASASSLMRDYSAWYHCVAVVDSTASTSTDRMILYLNGVRQTIGSEITLSQNYETAINSTVQHNLGANRWNSGQLNYSDGSLTEVNFIDGQALDASYFGYTDPLTNTWRPKKSNFKDITTSRIQVYWTYTGGSVGAGIYNAAIGSLSTGGSYSNNTWTASNSSWVDTWDMGTADSFTLSNWVSPGQSNEAWYWSNDPSFASGVTGPNGGIIANGTYSTTVSGTKYRYLRVQNIPGATYSVVGNITNSTNIFGVNGFYLPLDGNTPIGQDQSGRGNNWTPVNFGGSNTIEKATGALPILNTDGGGNVARLGTRTDAYASNLVLALPLVGSANDVSNQINSGSTTKTITANGNAAASSAQSNFYGGSFVFDGTGDYLNTSASSSDFTFGTGDFTVECWVYQTSASSDEDGIFQISTNSSGLNASNSNTVTLQTNSGAYRIYANDTSTAMSTSVITNQWVHLAVVRASGTTKLYVNGIQDATTISDTRNYSGTYLAIGGYYSTLYLWVGNISDFRVYKGVAKYTSNFIPASTDPDILPDTPSGVSGSSKLTKITDGAVSFDGSGDYLSIPGNTDFQMGTGDFTIECYFNVNGAVPTGCWRGMISLGGHQTSGGITIYAPRSSSPVDTVVVILNTVNPTLGSTINVKHGWHHVALVRNSGTTKLYVDGIEQSSISDTNDYNYSGTVYIGRDADCVTTYYEGFISNVRILKGTALYTSDFTPPTSALTNVTNTKLLCCQSTTSAGTAAVAPTIANNPNDGSIWSEVGTRSGTIIDWTSGFDGSRSTQTSNSSNTAAVITFDPVIPCSTATIWGNTGGSTAVIRINGTSVGGDGQNANPLKQLNTVDVSAQGGVQTISLQGTADGYAAKMGALICNPGAGEIDAANGAKEVIPAANASATTFNPFTTDINAVRGQESGYATLNPLDNNGGTLSDGNLFITSASTSNVNATLGVSSGKWYWECTITGSASGGVIGVGAGSAMAGTGLANLSKIYGWSPNGSKYQNTTQLGYAGTYGVGDIIGVSFDADTRQLTFYKNGLSQGVAFTVDSGYEYKPQMHLNGMNVACNFGQKPFKFPPPDGFQPLNAANVRPETVIARPDKYFGVVTFTGSASGGTYTLPISNPDLVWSKNRADGATNHTIQDSVRGFGDGQNIYSNLTNGPSGTGNILSINGTTATYGTNSNFTGNCVTWCWKAGGGSSSGGEYWIDDVQYADAAAAGLDGGSGITLTGASVGTKQGFSILRYTGGASGSTLSHGLTQAPDFWIIKNLSGSTQGTAGPHWYTKHHAGLTGGKTGNYSYFLNLTNGESNGPHGICRTSGDSLFEFVDGSSNDVNWHTHDSAATYICYAWHDVPGLQKFGTYQGSGTDASNGPGPFVELGFRPALVIVHDTAYASSNSDWCMFDSARPGYNKSPAQNRLEANKQDAEDGDGRVGNGNGIDILSNGFRIRSANWYETNTSGKFIYCAWAEAPTFNLYGAQSNAR